MPSPWDQLSSQKPKVDPLEALLMAGQGGEDPAASTPATDVMAAEQNPMPGVGAPPPQMNEGSIFKFNPRNQLPPEVNFGRQVQSALKQSEEANNQGLDTEKQGLKDYEAQVKAALAAPAGVDLTPLMALADAWKRGGGNMAASYKAPMSQQEKQMLATKLQDELQKRTHDLSKDEREMLKDHLNQKINIAKLSKDTSVANQMRMQAADASYLEKAQSHLNSDKGFVKAQGTIDEVNSVGKQLDAALQNPVAAAATPIALARMMTGGQRLNEVEINALGGSPGILNKLQQIAQTMQNGTLTPQNHKFMLDLANTLKRSAEENAIEIEHRHAKQFSKLTGADPEAAYMKITGKTPEEVEANQARLWVKANPKADPKQIANIRAHYGF